MGKFFGADIALWAGARIFGREGASFTGVCTDSRKIAPEELFIALKGGNFDGHDFLGAVYEKGCRGMVVSRLPEQDFPRATLFLVEDTAKALHDIARGHRSRFFIPVIGVTGSVGKTTTKEFIYGVLSQKGKTLKTQKNFNNEIGLPLSLLELTDDYWAGVFEMGMNHPGEMERLSEIARPTVGVITNIGVAHIENLGSKEGICRAKLEIARGMEVGATLLLNGDEPLLWRCRGRLAQKILYFGIENKECDYLACNIRETEAGQRFSVRGKAAFDCEITQKGAHNIYNALCAASLGDILGLDKEQIITGLLSFENAPMRQNIYEKNNLTVIDDCYNANPDSMKAALSVLSSMGGRAAAFLGDMLELGSYSEAAHREIGRFAAKAGVATLFLKGPAMKYAAEAAIEAGMEESRVFWSARDEDLAAIARALLQPGDRVLFKGSRGMKMEKLLALTLEGKEDA